jgi:tetratricopeptide (TPR) repeat protein
VKGYRFALAVVLAAWAWGAQAQALPSPREFYFDKDQAAGWIVVVRGEGETQAAALLAERDRRGRRAVEATAQLGHLAYADGRVELGKALYEQALGNQRPDRGIGRQISWNHAWDLYRVKDYEAALKHWTVLVDSALGGPAWVPPTLAVALWQVGRRDEAVKWYAAAVRTEPTQWSTTADYATLLPEWTAAERATLAQVQAAWAAAPPAWP